VNIGARTLKTSLAVAISVYLCVLLNVGPPLFAAATAVICMQQSVGKGLRNGLEQIIVNTLSALVAIALGLVIPIEYLSMAIATIVMILLCTKLLRAPNQVVLAVMAAILILSSPHDQFISQSASRFLAILIGLTVANIINFTIAPPQYSKLLVEKLSNLNLFTEQAFVDSVNRYLHLTTVPESENIKNQAEFNRLLEEAEELFNLFNYTVNVSIISKKGNKDVAERLLYKEYIKYNQGLWQRSQDLLFLAEERRARRQKANEPPISSEFQNIFEMLLNVVFNATSYNLELRKKIKGEEAIIYPEPHVWSKLNEMLNKWQGKTPSDSFYVHAWLEVSVITYNIRWFAKESTRLLSMEV